ncbi:hypothetical protein SFRURICE_017754 [Spodoptera frugiperda]|nr:hypothetical protein SFRURICE_017754 [Spodoptera frugiperda]
MSKVDKGRIPQTRILICHGCVYKFKYIQTRNNNLWITQTVAPCENRSRYTLRGSQLPSHRANRAVKLILKDNTKY